MVVKITLTLYHLHRNSLVILVFIVCVALACFFVLIVDYLDIINWVEMRASCQCNGHGFQKDVLV